MSRTMPPSVENVKVMGREEQAQVSSRIMTSNDARRLGLPDNCIVIPMQVLNQPEPIKRRRK